MELFYFYSYLGHTYFNTVSYILQHLDMMDVLWNILVTYVIVMTLNTGQAYLMSQTNITEEGILREGKTLVEDFFSRYNTTEEVDLVFILDRSASVPPSGWQSIVNFV